jgi:hypothetical protein
MSSLTCSPSRLQVRSGTITFTPLCCTVDLDTSSGTQILAAVKHSLSREGVCAMLQCPESDRIEGRINAKHLTGLSKMRIRLVLQNEQGSRGL